MPKGPKPQAEIYQIKLTLIGAHPPIWRRIQVEGSIPLATLHRVIQVVMGWSNFHLHRFRVKGTAYGRPEPGDVGPNKPEDERNFALCDLVSQEGSRLTYEYDFGDNWQHEILIEWIQPAEEGAHYPSCLEGAGACPPEDVGGVSGYDHFLEAMADPKHPEHQDYRAWIGGDFIPPKFDLARINRILAKSTAQ